MSYTAKELIDDVLGRVDDETGQLNRSWLLHLLNLAQTDFAKNVHWWEKEHKHTIDKRFNCLSLPDDFLEMKALKYSADGLNYRILFPMDKEDVEYYGNQKYSQAILDAAGKIWWEALIMPENDNWGWTKTSNVYGLLEDEKLKMTLTTSKYLYWEKSDISLNAERGWGIEGKVILPSFSGGEVGVGLTNNVFSVTDDNGGISINLWTLPDYTTCWVEIHTEVGTEEIECAAGNELVFKLTADIQQYSIVVGNITTSATHTYTHTRTLSTQTPRIIFGGELIGSNGTHTDLRWVYLWVDTTQDTIRILPNNIAQNTPASYGITNLLFLNAIANGYLLLEYYYKPAKLIVETDIVAIPDEEVELLVLFILKRVYTKLGQTDDALIAGREYRDGLAEVATGRQSQEVETLWEPGGGY